MEVNIIFAWTVFFSHNNESDKAELLCGACGFGKLPVVINLIEQHQLDPNGEC